MIISHKHKFIFFKTAKTAGTSIEVALRAHCSDEDIITPIIEERMDGLPAGTRPAQNYSKPFSWYTKADWLYLIKNLKAPQYFNHYPAHNLFVSIDPDIWSSYYKFCFARNPWDRVISYYYWSQYREDKSPDKQSLDEFITSHDVSRLNQLGYELYTYNDAVLVDKVYAFEDLAGSIDDLQQRFSFNRLELPKLKSGYRKDKRHYREIFTDSQAQFIAEKFAKEIALMDYIY